MQKIKKYRGQSYISTNGGVPRLGKNMRKSCDRKICRLNCTARVTEQQRQMVFDEFYSLGSAQLQWIYLAKRCGKIEPKYGRGRSKNVRDLNVSYNFIINDVMVQVCKVMFLNTLCVANGKCRTAMKKCVDGVLVEKDKRGIVMFNKVK